MLPGVGVFGTGKLLEAVVPHLRSLGLRVVALWGQTIDDAAKVAGELSAGHHQLPLLHCRAAEMESGIVDYSNTLINMYHLCIISCAI